MSPLSHPDLTISFLISAPPLVLVHCQRTSGVHIHVLKRPRHPAALRTFYLILVAPISKGAVNGSKVPLHAAELHTSLEGLRVSGLQRKNGSVQIVSLERLPASHRHR